MPVGEQVTAVLMIAMLVVAVFAVVAYISTTLRMRHHRVLQPFYGIRRELIDITLAPHGKFSPDEDAAARFLLTTVNGVIRHYHSHKTALFNLRAIRRAIEKDLRRYRQIQAKVRAQIADLPDNAKIRKAYCDFVIATTDAYVANTPFIRTEIVLRLLGRSLAEQVKTARRDSQQVLRDMKVA